MKCEKRFFFKYFLLLLICIVLLNLPLNYTQKIKYKAVNFFKTPLTLLENFTNFLLHYSDYHKLISENKTLTAENIELKLYKTQLDYLRDENEKLRNLLDFKKQMSYTTVVGEIIGFSYSESEKIIFISRGEKDGVSKNMVCLGMNGLIGRVVEVGESISKIMCINDPNSKVPAKTVDTNDFGLICGIPKGDFLEMRFLPKDSRTRIGAQVVTSGLGKIYPHGMLIGEIYEIKEEEFFKVAYVKPMFNFLSLEIVLLVKQK